jgi:hypothetical protein
MLYKIKCLYGNYLIDGVFCFDRLRDGFSSMQEMCRKLLKIFLQYAGGLPI